MGEGERRKKWGEGKEVCEEGVIEREVEGERRWRQEQEERTGDRER